MNIREHRQLQAEATALSGMLERLPAHRAIERSGLESRRRAVEKELASQAMPPEETAAVRLTFGGKPVVVGQGIRAEFGVDAVKKFANAVATVGAAQNRSLPPRGALPNREHYDLLITDTALGSFGFELRSAPSRGVLPAGFPVDSAIEQTKSILEATTGTDEDLANAISETHPRALKALHAFLKKMADQEAVCAIEHRDEVFRFADVAQVRTGERRLRQENIHHEQRVIRGQFLGVLPAQRTFEFQEADTDRVISGRVDRTIGDASKINGVLGKPLQVRLLSKRIGASNERFVLLDHDYREDLLMEGR